MVSQASLPFYGMPTRPLSPRQPSRAPGTSPKRSRALTTTGEAAETLPPARRLKRAPALKHTTAFLFAGVHPLYRREIIEEEHCSMMIYCTQLGCDYSKKISRSLQGTNNHKTHYQNKHPGIPLSEKEVEARAKLLNQKAGSEFFERPKTEQSQDELYRTLLLEFIIKNNLSFSLVDQPETRALFTFLSPNTKQISRKVLMADLRKRYERGENVQYKDLQDHVESGGRISLTTDGWAGNNKLDYIAVTGHYITKLGEHKALLLDIIELEDAVHSGAYLATKLLAVTDRLNITCAILAITRDNASPNDTMLDDFEAEVEERYEAMEPEKQAFFCCRYNRIDGDVRCCAHIYNIAVQAGKLLFDVPCINLLYKSGTKKCVKH
jgi:hypothetical protein